MPVAIHGPCIDCPVLVVPSRCLDLVCIRVRATNVLASTSLLVLQSWVVDPFPVTHLRRPLLRRRRDPFSRGTGCFNGEWCPRLALTVILLLGGGSDTLGVTSSRRPHQVTESIPHPDFTSTLISEFESGNSISSPATFPPLAPRSSASLPFCLFF